MPITLLCKCLSGSQVVYAIPGSLDKMTSSQYLKSRGPIRET